MILKSLEEFYRILAKLPQDKQQEVARRFEDLVHNSLDENKFLRLMATAIKYAKDAKVEGHDEIDVTADDLEKLTNIQDKNRLVQAHLKKKE